MRIAATALRLSFALVLAACTQPNSAASPLVPAVMPGDCSSIEVEVRAADVRSASGAMLAGSSEQGRESWTAMRRELLASPAGQTSAIGRLLESVGPRMNWYDVCFSGDCSRAGERSPRLLFGCEYQNCRSKGAALLDRHGRAVALATAELTSEADSQADRPAITIFVLDRSYARERVRSLMTAWFALQQNFVLRTATGNEPNRLLLDRFGAQDSRLSIHATECIL